VSKFQQDTFNTVWNHFVVGCGKPSYKPRDGSNSAGVECMYRGPNGAKCGIGILIPDDEYNEKFEGNAVESLNPSLFGLDADTTQGEKDFEFLMDIQAAHDFAAGDAELQPGRSFSDLMRSQLKGVAEVAGLKVPPTVAITGD
jgi:hypothetical protein